MSWRCDSFSAPTDTEDFKMLPVNSTGTNEGPIRSGLDKYLPCFGRSCPLFSSLLCGVLTMYRINSVCSTGKGSVPRGRVYANYASRCATERITVLNPASFGKLVRVLFPGLKTRRLGVRGESKYHYVNFALVDDQPEARESQAPPPRLLSEPRTHASQSFQ